jgi:hypothetical protein
MKWFRHYASLHRQPESQHIIRKFGLEWYARYILLLELCAEQYEGEKSATTIVLERDYLKTSLRVVGDQWLTTLRLVGDLNGFTFQVVGDFIKFEMAILSELHHKDSTSSKIRRASGGPVAGPRLELDKELDKEEDSITLKRAGLRESDFEIFYSKYPRKVGKERGRKTFKAQIRSEDDLHSLNLALDNYIAYVKQNVREARYILHFSTFMNSWKDWLDPKAGSVEGTNVIEDDSWVKEFEKKLANRNKGIGT